MDTMSGTHNLFFARLSFSFVYGVPFGSPYWLVRNLRVVINSTEKSMVWKLHTSVLTKIEQRYNMSAAIFTQHQELIEKKNNKRLKNTSISISL